jgi:hypothetical protein
VIVLIVFVLLVVIGMSIGLPDLLERVAALLFVIGF